MTSRSRRAGDAGWDPVAYPAVGPRLPNLSAWLVGGCLLGLVMLAPRGFGGQIPKPREGAVVPRGSLDCTDAVEVTLDDCYPGSNVGAPENVDRYGCRDWDESGGEVVFHLFLDEPTRWEALLTAETCDLDLAILDRCDEELGCLELVDSGFRVRESMSGDLFFVVDGFAGAACDFELCFSSLPPLPPACSVVQPLACATGSLAGDTCAGDNFVDDLACAHFSHGGLENWYSMDVASGGSFTAEVTLDDGDCALLLLGSCDPAGDCLVYADENQTGESETIGWTNFTTETLTVYLVVDAWAPAQLCGSYHGDYICTPAGQPSALTTWGTLKAAYR